MTGSPPTGHARFSPSIDLVEDRGRVELWSAWIDRDEDLTASLAMLDDAERMRADRFRFQHDRDRFIARRAFVRRVLARYLAVEPVTIAIHTTPHGKPELDASLGLSFNASHSNGLAVLAVARGRRVGVDIERVRPLDDPIGLAPGLLTERELAGLMDLPPAARSASFLTLWTRKESTVKAIGGGLSIPLDSFDISTVGATGVGRPRGPFGDLPFAFTAMAGLDGYLGTVTIEGANVDVRHVFEASVAA